MFQYLGITGATHRSHIDALIPLVEAFIPPKARFMNGILQSTDTLYGRVADNPRRYPRKQDVARLFPPHRQFLNLVHYKSTDPDIAHQLKRVLDYAGPYCDGIQLNMEWPDLEELASFRRHHPDTILVLQLNAACLEEIERDPEKTGHRLHWYYELMNAVLVDASEGRGVPIDVERANKLRRQIHHALHGRVPVGIAGGFGPDTAETVRELWQRQKQWDSLNQAPVLWTPMSIDMEGRVRTKEDDLDIDACASSLKRLAPVLFT